MTKQVFFCVYVEGGRAPIVKHDSLESAEKEAKRLAEIHGIETFVLATIKSFKLNKFEVKDCRPSTELPF